MYFNNKFYYISFLIVYLRLIKSTSSMLKVSNSGLNTVHPCAIGLIFYAEVNNTSTEDFEVEITPDECCLSSGKDFDCGSLDMTQGCMEIIPKGTSKTVYLITPLLNPYERQGYCKAHVDAKSTKTKRHVARETIKVAFDTRLTNRNQVTMAPKEVKSCSVDEDPLEDCNPVECDVHYNGRKGYYSKHMKRCLDVPQCVAKYGNEEDIDPVYDPVNNECDHKQPITDEDVAMLKRATYKNEYFNEDHGDGSFDTDVLILKNKTRQKKDYDLDDDEFVMEAIENSTNPSDKKAAEPNQNEPHTNSPSSVEKNPPDLKTTTPSIKSQNKYKSLIHEYVSSNKCAMVLLGFIVLIQCFLIFTLAYFFTAKWCCKCTNNQKYVRKYFNYRNDASMTTPLIATSNHGTETTDYQYLSDSSNVDRKIKCYKACQKENPQTSLSDDILAKCLNRRAWYTKTTKSTGGPEASQTDQPEAKLEDEYSESKKVACYNMSRRKHPSRITIEDEIKKKPSCRIKGQDFDLKCVEEDDFNEADSEYELKCHSYEYPSDKSKQDNRYDERKSTKDILKVNDKHSKKNKPKPDGDYITQTKTDQNLQSNNQVISMNQDTRIEAEKGAQANFSNDSIDEFLSQRGVLYMAGENLSKYSFSNEDSIDKTRSTRSSRTSKVNVVKNVMSLLSKKSKPSSEPDKKKSKESLNVELLHIRTPLSFDSTPDSKHSSIQKTHDSGTSI